MPAPLLLLPWLSLTNEFELDEPLRPQRAGFNDAKKDDAREFEPKRERDDDEPADELVLPPATTFGGVDSALDDDGVFRPEEPEQKVIFQLNVLKDIGRRVCIFIYVIFSFLKRIFETNSIGLNCYVI